MGIVLGILILVFTIQGQGPPPLPGKLARDPELAPAVIRQLADPDPARRQEAFQTIRPHLAGEPVEEQATFLLACGQRRLVPADVLRPEWQRLARDWPDLRQWLRQRLAAGAEGGAALGGVLQAVALLTWPPAELPGLVEEVARHLDDVGTVHHAREALLEITGHDFRNWAAFNAWWSSGMAEAEPLAWWRDAAATRRKEIVELWTLRLRSNDPVAMFDALASQVFEVRRMALEALGTRFPAEAGEEILEQGRQALLQALQQERDPVLRRMILELVPRFFSGEAARNVLDAALQAETREERLAAARALQLVRPPAAALGSILAALETVYPPEGEQPNWGPDLRTALFRSLAEVMQRQHPEADGGVAQGLAAVVTRALEMEHDTDVRREVYMAAARLDGPEFQARLVVFAGDDERPDDDRVGALAALRVVPVQEGERDALLELLHGLLDHPSVDLRYQALLVLKRLKDPRSASVLGRRLGLEQDPGPLKKILEALREMPGGQGLEPLLAQPAPEGPQLQSLFLAALRDQVGADVGRLKVALANLRAHGDREVAVKLLEGFPKDALAGEEEAAWFDEEYVRNLAAWLLGVELDNGLAVRAEDAVGRLRALRKAALQEPEWPRLEALLLARLGRHGEALPAWRRVLELQPPEQAWPARLEAARAALAAGLRQEGLAFLAAGDGPPEELGPEVEEVRRALEALPPPPAVEEEVPPAPAPGEGGEATGSGPGGPCIPPGWR